MSQFVFRELGQGKTNICLVVGLSFPAACRSGDQLVDMPSKNTKFTRALGVPIPARLGPIFVGSPIWSPFPSSVAPRPRIPAGFTARGHPQPGSLSMHRQLLVLIPSLGRFHSSQIRDLALASGDFYCPGCHGQFTISKNGRSRKQNLATSCSHPDVSDQIERERETNQLNSKVRTSCQCPRQPGGGSAIPRRR